MKHLQLFLFLFLFCWRLPAIAQENPYESLGIETKVLTLSNGKYQEFFPNDTLVPIGNVMLNTITGEVLGFTEEDSLLSTYRLEPEVVSRFLSVDPLAVEYPELSPYAYVANNPVLYIDPDGRRIVLPNQSQGNALAGDLNRIYQNKYGVSDAFKVVSRDVTVTKANPDYGFWDMINPWSDTPETITETETRTFIETTESFSQINGDKYTERLKEIIDADTDITVRFIEDKGSEARGRAYGSKKGFVETHGGGFTDSPNQVTLSDGLKKTSTTDPIQNQVYWTIGAVALHELLYHIHPAGDDENNHPNIMRSYYQQRDDGGDHGVGKDQNHAIKN